MAAISAFPAAHGIENTTHTTGDLDANANEPGTTRTVGTAPNDSVFLVTDRLAKPRRSGGFNFSERRGSDLSYGRIETATKKSIQDLNRDQFLEELSKSHTAAASRIIVFVHGYNCNIKIPYQIAVALAEQTESPVVMFSWPSKRNPLTYANDECNAEYSSFQLAQILEDLQARFGNSNITLIGHSMGCRMLCWALQHIQAEGINTSRAVSKYGHILLCAPDIDSQIFEKNIPNLVKSSSDVRVFASKKDVRLFFSRVFHGNTRLGLLSRHSAKSLNNEPWSQSVQLVDYTEDDRTIFGHAIPYSLIRKTIIGG